MNCISYWFPKISDLQVPKTIIIKSKELIDILDNNFECFGTLPQDIASATKEVGLPAFLRSGHTSGKHYWTNTCYLTSDDHKTIINHLYNIVDYSHCTSLFGLPCDVWVVREMLPTKIFGHAYHSMPIAREFRVFAKNGKILCHHPYWPHEAINDLPLDKYNELCDGYTNEVANLAIEASKRLSSAWSIDIIDTEKGWYITDMAEAEKSWHWPGCKNNGSTP